MISTYQSQNECQVVSYSASTASWNRYAVKPASHARTAAASSASIHRSSGRNVSGLGGCTSRSAIDPLPTLATRNPLVTCHSLLANRWYEAIRSSSKRMSWTLVDTAAAHARTASAPYLSARSRGSTVLPFDLLMREPSAAWIVLVISTSLNGIRPVNLMPVMIIRETQRKMMSRPVTRRSVG